MGKRLQAAIDELVKDGIFTPEIATIVTGRKERTARRAPCVSCGETAGPLDYICLGCSAHKAQDQRRFWDAVREREAGGRGLKCPPTSKGAACYHSARPENGNDATTCQSPAPLPAEEAATKGYTIECDDCGGVIFTGSRYPATVGKSVTKTHAEVTEFCGVTHEARVRLQKFETIRPTGMGKAE